MTSPDFREEFMRETKLPFVKGDFRLFTQAVICLLSLILESVRFGKIRLVISFNEENQRVTLQILGFTNGQL